MQSARTTTTTTTTDIVDNAGDTAPAETLASSHTVLNQEQDSRHQQQQVEDQIDLDFVPEKQKITGILSGLISIFLLVLGSILLIAPTWVLVTTLREEENDYTRTTPSISRIDLLLCRLTGGILFGQGLSSLLLLVNLFDDFILQSKSIPRLVSVDKCRTAISTQGLIGLIFVIVALIDNRSSPGSYESSSSDSPITTVIDSSLVNDDDEYNGNNETNNIHSLWILTIGFGILITSCFGLMFSYWPVLLSSFEEEESSTIRNNGHNSNLRTIITQTNDSEYTNSSSLTEPLLGDGTNIEVEDLSLPAHRILEDDLDDNTNDHDDDDETSPSAVTPTMANRSIMTLTDEDHHHSDEEDAVVVETSRIRGTRRLLNLASSQVLYLYIGCVVLLIRLPFSLSIPHFVSTTIGAVQRGDFTTARTEILLLFILGTIDAVLDFWCVFLFGYGKFSFLSKTHTSMDREKMQRHHL